MDTAVLLETNSRFVEAFLVGLNEELARELLWREYPAYRTGTFFQTFWGATQNGAPTVDIPPIAAFDINGHLGDHMADHATGGSLVLLIRGELFRRYPNALVSAVRAKWNDDKQTRGLGTDRQWPIFRGEIGTDIVFFGFDVDDPKGSDDPAAGNPGWYFLIEEHATEPRFGLEPETSPPSDKSWNELRWTLDPTLPVVVMTAWGSVDGAVEAMRRGARDYVEKPWDNARLRRDAAHADRARRARCARSSRLEDGDHAPARRDQLPALIAESPPMQPSVCSLIERVGPSDANVLITGRARHRQGGRRRAGCTRRRRARRGRSSP